MEIQVLTVGMIQTNCYLVQDGEGSFLVDPGDQAEELLAYFKKQEVSPGTILITHGHFDHVGAVPELAEALQAEVVFPEKEIAYLDERSYSLMSETASALDRFKSFLTQYEKTRLVSDGDSLTLCGAEVRCLEVPGHTDHSMAYYIPSESVVFSGDTLFARSVGRSDMYSGDPGDLVRNIREKLLTLPKETYVLPGHGGVTTIGREAEINPYLRAKHE